MAHGWFITPIQSTNKLFPSQDRDGNPVDVQVKDNGNGTYSCSYTPRKPLKHTVMVSWGGVNIPESPFRVGSQSDMVNVLGISNEKCFNVFSLHLLCRWTLGQGAIPIRWKYQDLEWPRLALRHLNQLTSLWIVLRRDRVRTLSLKELDVN